MTDGPFKYTSLSQRWKSYGETLDTKILDSETQRNYAQKALVEDLTPSPFRTMLRDMEQQLGRLDNLLSPQLGMSIFESIVDKHSACEQSEVFRNQMLANMRGLMDARTAFDSALHNTFAIGISQADQRIRVHCIRVDEKRAVKNKESALRKTHAETFSSINPGFLVDAIFKKASASPVKSAALRSMEGPPL